MISNISFVIKEFLGNPRVEGVIGNVQHSTFDELLRCIRGHAEITRYVGTDANGNVYNRGVEIIFDPNEGDPGPVFITRENYEMALFVPDRTRSLIAAIVDSEVTSTVLLYSFQHNVTIAKFVRQLQVIHHNYASLEAAVKSNHDVPGVVNLMQIVGVLDADKNPLASLNIGYTDWQYHDVCHNFGLVADSIVRPDDENTVRVLFGQTSYERTKHLDPYVCLYKKRADIHMASLYSTLTNLDLRLKSICDQK